MQAVTIVETRRHGQQSAQSHLDESVKWDALPGSEEIDYYYAPICGYDGPTLTVEVHGLF